MMQFSLKRLLLSVTLFSAACGSCMRASVLLESARAKHGDDSNAKLLMIWLMAYIGISLFVAAFGILCLKRKRA